MKMIDKEKIKEIFKRGLLLGLDNGNNEPNFCKWEDEFVIIYKEIVEENSPQMINKEHSEDCMCEDCFEYPKLKYKVVDEE